MSIISIAIDIKNPAEVLGCYGILALDFLLDKQITRSRFVEGLKLHAGADGRLRSGIFDFEHLDFAGLLTKCHNMVLSVNDKKETTIKSDGKTVLVLDWYNTPALFLGDSGNFAQTGKSDFVATHQQSLSKIDDNYRNLFSTATSIDATNYLSSYNVRKKAYQDAGGTYEAEDVFYVSEWFLLFAMQVFRHPLEKYLRLQYRLRYGIYTSWLSTNAAFAGIAGGHHSCKQFESEKRKFGKGAVLRVAQEISSALSSPDYANRVRLSVVGKFAKNSIGR